MMFDVTETVTPGTPPDADARRGSDESPAADGLSRGVSVGRYVTLERLGQGGMGAVYSAFDPELERTVALKVVRPDLRDPEAARARLVAEAKTAAGLSHPNLVQVHDAGTVGEFFFLAMERIEGRDLARVLSEDELTWRQKLALFLAAGEGLRAAHAAGLVHRDFKPSNVMVADDGRVVLVDFGLAGAVSDPSPRLQGTPGYMAPEQMRGVGASAKTDQYSFCAALYRALHGVTPPGSATPTEPAGKSPEVPAWLERILARGLATEPEERFEDLGELLAALRRDPARRRRRLLAASLLVFVVGGVAALAYRAGGAPPVPCRNVEHRLDGIWDDARRSAIRDVVLSSELPFARATWNLVERRVDAFAGRWVELHVEACEATRRAEQTEHLLDLQVACLETRLFDLEAALSLLATGDDDVLRRADSVSRMSNLEGCRDRDVLLNLEPPPMDPEIAAQVTDLRRELADLRRRVDAGRYADVIPRAHAAVERADELGYLPLAAEARLVVAASAGFTGRFNDARRGFLEAAQMALASRHDELLACSLTYLTILSRVVEDSAAAHTWAELADAAISRLDNRSDLRADHDFALGMVTAMEGDPEGAIGHFEAFLDRAEGASNDPSHAHHNIAKAYARMGRLDQAAEALERSLELMQRDLGEVHPKLMPTLEMYSGVRRRAGDLEEALDLIERALQIAEIEESADYRIPAYQTARATLLVELGRASEAIEPLERVLARYQTGDAPPLWVADGRFALARALWTAGSQPRRDRPRAVELARSAWRSYRDAPGGRPEEAETVEAWLAARAGPFSESGETQP